MKTYLKWDGDKCEFTREEFEMSTYFLIQTLLENYMLHFRESPKYLFVDHGTLIKLFKEPMVQQFSYGFYPEFKIFGLEIIEVKLDRYFISFGV